MFKKKIAREVYSSIEDSNAVYDKEMFDGYSRRNYSLAERLNRLEKTLQSREQLLGRMDKLEESIEIFKRLLKFKTVDSVFSGYYPPPVFSYSIDLGSHVVTTRAKPDEVINYKTVTEPIKAEAKKKK